VTLAGAHPKDFRIQSLGRTWLALGGTTTFVVQFQPQAVGDRNATLKILSNDPNEGSFEIRLEGLGME
jgi:hypothetical protein